MRRRSQCGTWHGWTIGRRESAAVGDLQMVSQVGLGMGALCEEAFPRGRLLQRRPVRTLEAIVRLPWLGLDVFAHRFYSDVQRRGCAAGRRDALAPGDLGASATRAYGHS